ncbi:SUMF1/EgtB/PvdO family nonheme iron enzyme, partial [candidate division KSB1 bacterium]|nr:SUMF1/EgtB/PvdO family nonheme iron enzyme [candidate division KSB1 bacterium]
LTGFGGFFGAQLQINFLMLLTLIVMIAASDINLPEQRHELYRECVDVMADAWGQSKQKDVQNPSTSPKKPIRRDEKLKLLAALAHEMQCKRQQPDEPSLIPREQVKNLIVDKLQNEFKLPIPKDEARPDQYYLNLALNLLDDIRVQSGILIEKGYDPASGDSLIAFSHLSFQEYLTALCIKERKQQALLYENLLHPAWQEVVKLYWAMTVEEEIIIRLLDEKIINQGGLLLAATCAIESKMGISTVYLDKIFKKLRENFLNADHGELSQRLAAIVSFGGNENVDLLFELIESKDESFALNIVNAIGKLNFRLYSDPKLGFLPENWVNEPPLPGDKKSLTLKLLKLLESPDKLSIKMKAAIGQAVESLGDPRFESIEPTMVLIPKGEFICGRDKREFWEFNKHKRNLPAFEIGKYPVTNIEYKRFIDATGHRQPKNWKEGFFPSGRGNHPVIYVDWFDAQAYCQWLNRTSPGRKKYCLPTEFEWEKAARGTDGREYPWGDEFDEAKCNSFKQIGDTSPVGIFWDGVSPNGLFDMAGNVWEWTDSRLEFWDRIKWKIPFFNRTVGTVVRGGSWDNDITEVFRCADRVSNDPDDRDVVIGFRVVSSAQSVDLGI